MWRKMRQRRMFLQFPPFLWEVEDAVETTSLRQQLECVARAFTDNSYQTVRHEKPYQTTGKYISNYHPENAMKTWIKTILVSSIAILFLQHSPTLLDYEPEAFSSRFLPLRGPLAINNKLAETEHLFAGSIFGPESIVVHEGNIFTGTEDGQIVKIQGNKIIPIAQMGTNCHMPYEERLCGRPLGLRMGKDGLLYIADAYYGLHRMNITNGLLTRILPNSVVIEGAKLTFPDDLDIDDSGNIYFSDASSKWDISNIFYLMTEHEGSGRIIQYNIYSGEAKVIMNNLYFPNGVQISHDGNSLLVCEISKRRILRYFLKGSKKGKAEVLISDLPGEPDNIRLSERGGYWVAIATARNDSHPLISDVLGPYPFIRRIWARAQHAIGSVLMAIADLSSSHVFKKFAYSIRRGDIMLAAIPQYGLIIELDDNGNIIRNYQAPDGSTSTLSQVTEHDGYLYLGSFINPYLGRLKLT